MITSRVIIVDDEEDARELIKFHLKSFSWVEVVGEATNGSDAIALIDSIKPDVVLLDIQMPEVNGLEVVERISHRPYVIFITAYDEYAVKAFELHAVDYLLKPFSPERLSEAMKRTSDYIKQDLLMHERYLHLIKDLTSVDETNYINRIAAKVNHKTHFIDVADIIMIEAADQYVTVYTSGQNFLIRNGMDYFEKALDPENFFRTHRSFIVALSAIQSLEKYEPKHMMVHLKDGYQAKLSLSRKMLFESKLKMG